MLPSFLSIMFGVCAVNNCSVTDNAEAKYMHDTVLSFINP